MTRIIVLLSLACACIAAPARAQQQPAPADSRSDDDLAALLDAVGGLLRQDGDHYQIVERVQLPVPRQPGFKVFADTVDIYFDTDRLIASGDVSFEMPNGRINADRI